ncbi:MAG: glycosyltransferase family 4 protein [Salinivirgaceae bacterium]|nr:glycosyltransferase family 4 protein [Salinivirgaceae bacterium]
MALTVYFFGSLPNGVEPYYGGGEIGNQRTVNMLRGFGYKVRVVKKLRCKATTTMFVKLLTYPFRFLVGVSAFLTLLIFGSRKAIVHISGFYGLTIIGEYILVEAAKLLGYSIIYEIRGECVEAYRNTGCFISRFCFARILRISKIIFSQGVESEAFLRSLTNKPIFHYPNYVEEGYLPPVLPQKPQEIVNLVYFGRIEAQKNVKMIVEVASILQRHMDISLTIIGKGHHNYVSEVVSLMEQKLKPGTYSFISGYARIGIRTLLLDKHFLIFPSAREGQSNTITESMSCGVVPISSPQGFSRTVIGNNRMIVDHLTAQSYADRVLEIMADGSFGQLSEIVYERIKSNYTQAVIEPKLREQYERLGGE